MPTIYVICFVVEVRPGSPSDVTATCQIETKKLRSFVVAINPSIHMATFTLGDGKLEVYGETNNVRLCAFLECAVTETQTAFVHMPTLTTLVKQVHGKRDRHCKLIICEYGLTVKWGCQSHRLPNLTFEALPRMTVPLSLAWFTCERSSDILKFVRENDSLDVKLHCVKNVLSITMNDDLQQSVYKLSGTNDIPMSVTLKKKFFLPLLQASCYSDNVRFAFHVDCFSILFFTPYGHLQFFLSFPPQIGP